MEHPFTWHSFLLSFSHQLDFLPEPTFMALVVVLIVLALALSFRRAVLKAVDPAVPEDRLGSRNIMEMAVEMVVSLSDSIIGKKGRQYVPFFGTLFIFILTSNLLGLVPGFTPPTNSFFTNLALGLVVFVVYNYHGIREHGMHYIKQFLGPVIWL